MDLSIITVPWNVKDLVRDNFNSIYNNTTGIDFEVIAIDNQSKDGTVEMLRKEFPQVNVIANNYNAGFSKANNQGIKIAKGDFVLLLNPDMRVNKGTLEGMVKWMKEHPEAGVAGCKLVSQTGETLPHVRRYPTIWDQLVIMLKLVHLFPGLLNKYLYKDFDYETESEVDSIRGSFFMIRREVLDKLKGLDERYFIWFEEVDFCRQTTNAGYKIMYTPVVSCVDFVGKSFSQVKRYKTQQMFTDSMLKYFKKWHPGWRYLLLKICHPFALASVWVTEKLHIKRDVSKIKN